MHTQLEITEDILPVIFSLIDQVYGLRSELRVLTEAVQNQDEEVRRRILNYVEQKCAELGRQSFLE